MTACTKCSLPDFYHYTCRVCDRHFTGNKANEVGNAMWDHPCHQIITEAWFAMHMPDLAR